MGMRKMGTVPLVPPSTLPRSLSQGDNATRTNPGSIAVLPGTCPQLVDKGELGDTSEALSHKLDICFTISSVLKGNESCLFPLPISCLGNKVISKIRAHTQKATYCSLKRGSIPRT